MVASASRRKSASVFNVVAIYDRSEYAIVVASRVLPRYISAHIVISFGMKFNYINRPDDSSPGERPSLVCENKINNNNSGL